MGKNPDFRPLTESEKLAQAALRAWFNDPTGFSNMEDRNNRSAAKAVAKLLQVQPPLETGENQP